MNPPRPLSSRRDHAVVSLIAIQRPDATQVAGFRKCLEQASAEIAVTRTVPA